MMNYLSVKKYIHIDTFIDLSWKNVKMVKLQNQQTPYKMQSLLLYLFLYPNVSSRWKCHTIWNNMLAG
jgi:hypothetical protein